MKPDIRFFNTVPLPRLFHLLIIGLILLSPFMDARQLKFERLNNIRGLDASTIYSLMQDSSGFLWLITDRGLARFDGYGCKFYHPTKSFGDPIHNRITVIYEDSRKQFWAGTIKGLYRLTDRKDRFIPYSDHSKSGLSESPIRTIFEDSSRYLWIGTSQRLFRLDPKRKDVERFKISSKASQLRRNIIVNIVETPDGEIWIVSRNGISRFDGKNRFQFFPIPVPSPQKGQASINSSFLNRYKQVWMGGHLTGLQRFDIESRSYSQMEYSREQSESLVHNMIFNIREDNREVLWLSTIKGLYLYDNKTGEWEKILHDPGNPHSLSQNDVRTSFQDRSGNYWIGTLGGGLNKLGRNALNFSHMTEGPDHRIHLNNKMVWAIYEDRNQNLWIGTDRGLNLWDRQQGRFFYFLDRSDPKFSNNFIMTICEDHQRNIWAGTSGSGLKRFDRISKSFTSYTTNPSDPRSISHNIIHAIIEDQDRQLWIGTSLGLNQYHREKDSFSRFVRTRSDRRLKSNMILSLLLDSQDTFWIGSSQGLNVFDRDQKHFKKPPILSDIATSISYIFEDSEQQIWFGTRDGLYKFERPHRLIRYGMADGLTSDLIVSIVEDDQKNLWLGTTQGLSKLNKAENRITNYFKADGLLSNEFTPRACFRNRKGQMLFGSLNGITVFHPDEITENRLVPTIEITDFNLFNRPISTDRNAPLQASIELTDQIRLNHNQNFFSFEFTALDFTNPGRNRYKYKLAGVDPEWIECSADRRYVNYTGIEPGRYRFTVKGANSDGTWNQTGRSIQIRIDPPFWKTWWFRLFMALCLLALILYLYKQRIIKIEQKLRSENAVKELCQKFKITAREQEILNLILEGKSNKQIEEILFISYNTVKNHVHNIFNKIGVKNRSDLILFFKSTADIEKKNK